MLLPFPYRPPDLLPWPGLRPGPRSHFLVITKALVNRISFTVSGQRRPSLHQAALPLDPGFSCAMNRGFTSLHLLEWCNFGPGQSIAPV